MNLLLLLLQQLLSLLLLAAFMASAEMLFPHPPLTSLFLVILPLDADVDAVAYSALLVPLFHLLSAFFFRVAVNCSCCFFCCSLDMPFGKGLLNLSLGENVLISQPIYIASQPASQSDGQTAQLEASKMDTHTLTAT